VPLRTWIARALVGIVILCTALVSVGLTAPPGGPFTIAVQPVFMRLDAAAIAESRAHALTVDVDVTFGTAHLHFTWSAIPLTPMATKPAGTLL
jgi:hypothetical protein